MGIESGAASGIYILRFSLEGRVV